MAHFSFQLDILGKMEHLLRKCLNHIVLWDCLWDRFSIVTWHGRIQPTVGGIIRRQVSLSCIRKTADHVLGNLELLPWLPSMMSYNLYAKVNPFLLQLFLVIFYHSNREADQDISLWNGHKALGPGTGCYSLGLNYLPWPCVYNMWSSVGGAILGRFWKLYCTGLN